MVDADLKLWPVTTRFWRQGAARGPVPRASRPRARDPVARELRARGRDRRTRPSAVRDRRRVGRVEHSAASRATSGSDERSAHATGTPRASPPARAARSPRTAPGRGSRAVQHERGLDVGVARPADDAHVVARRRRVRARPAMLPYAGRRARGARRRPPLGLDQRGAASSRRGSAALADRDSSRGDCGWRARASSAPAARRRSAAADPCGTTSIRAGSAPEHPHEVVARALGHRDHAVRAAHRQRHERGHADAARRAARPRWLRSCTVVTRGTVPRRRGRGERVHRAQRAREPRAEHELLAAHPLDPVRRAQRQLARCRRRGRRRRRRARRTA